MAKELPKDARSRKSLYINTTIMVLIMVGLGYIVPPIGPITPMGMKVLGVFLGMVWGWSCVDFIGTSLLGMLFLGFSGYKGITAIFGEGFSGNLFLTVFFTFILAAYMERVGVFNKLATWFVSRKINVGRPYVFAFCIMLASYIMGAFISVTATIIIMWSMFYSICEVVGIKPGSKFAMLEMLGISFAADIGFTLFPFKAMAVLVIGSIETNLGMSPNSLSWTLTSFALSFVCLIAYVLVMKYILRPDVSALTSKEDRFAHLREEKLTFEQKVAAIAMLIFLVAVMIPSVLPACALKTFLNKLGIVGCLAATILVLSMMRKKDQGFFMHFNSDANSNVNWEVLLLFAATTPCGNALASADSGIMPALSQALNPVFADMSPVIFTIAFVVIFGAITQFAHNMVLAAVAVPIMCQFAVPLGANPLVVGVLMAFVLNIGICTPGGSTPGALAFANPKWITTAEAYKYNFVIYVMYTLITITWGVFVANIFM